MAARGPRRPAVLLTRHFLRQFLANDLVSPDADRSLTLAVVGAGTLSLTTFISVMMSFGYGMGALTPGEAAVASLTDKLFYLSFSMIVTALVATAQWEALSIDPRDAAILEPLPVPAPTIRRAKLAAIAILGGAVAILINVVPSLVFPWLLVSTLRQMGLVALVGLVVSHFVFTVAAAGFGYLAVVAVREAAAAACGPRLFARVSAPAQGLLIVALGGSLLLLPSLVGRTGARGAGGWRALAPPMWFLGAYELAAGPLIADLPRAAMSPRMAARDRTQAARYETWRKQDPGLARRAGTAFGLAGLIAACAHLWNARRTRLLAPPAAEVRRRRWPRLVGLANATLVRTPSARAGFYFALAAMWRSRSHRLTLASAAAAGLALAVLAASNVTIEPGGGAPTRLLAVQPLVCGALLVGFRHAIRIPAELGASWSFQVAWQDHPRAFVAGVRRAALVALALPVLAALLPLYAVVAGPVAAVEHLLLGLGGAAIVLEALMAGYDKVPFACAYLPIANFKARGPIYTIAFIVGATLFARLEHDAIFGRRFGAAAVSLIVVHAGLRLASLGRARPSPVDFDEAPATFQQLGLHT